MSDITDKEFPELAFKVASGKYTPDEHADLKKFLIVRTDMRGVYEQITHEVESTRDALGLLASMEVPPEILVPKEALRAFEATVDEILGPPTKPPQPPTWSAQPTTHTPTPAKQSQSVDIFTLSFLARVLVAFAAVIFIISAVGGLNQGFTNTVAAKGILWTHPKVQTPSGWYYLMMTSFFTFLAAALLKFLDHFLNRKR